MKFLRGGQLVHWRRRALHITRSPVAAVRPGASHGRGSPLHPLHLAVSERRLRQPKAPEARQPGDAFPRGLCRRRALRRLRYARGVDGCSRRLGSPAVAAAVPHEFAERASLFVAVLLLPRVQDGTPIIGSGFSVGAAFAASTGRVVIGTATGASASTAAYPTSLRT